MLNTVLELVLERTQGVLAGRAHLELQLFFEKI